MSSPTDPDGSPPDGDEPAVQFSAAELAYLLGERRLGRLATADAPGRPHVVPVGWSYNSDLGTVDVSGRNFAATRKYRNVQANPHAALVVDDVLPPWRPRCVLVQGPARSLEAGAGGGTEAMIRITPHKITSWGLDADPAQ
ncbi:MAG: PPOX class F420-dependent oxidoreductase [Actinomycetota bacterium]|nr:PPOX class F420-dependent oxidoreductase [Actinomycetota bacterium]